MLFFETHTHAWPSIVSGAGLGGIVLALFLKKSCPHISFEIYEAAAQLGEVGAGVALWPRVNEILDFLGIKEDVTRLAAGAGNSRKCTHYSHPKFVLKIDNVSV